MAQVRVPSYPVSYEIDVAGRPEASALSQEEYLRMIADAETHSPYPRKTAATQKRRRTKNDGGLAQVNLAINPLFPTPHTALEEVEMISYESYRDKIAMLADELADADRVTIQTVGRELYGYEQILKRGDASLQDALIEAVDRATDPLSLVGDVYVALYQQFCRALESRGIESHSFGCLGSTDARRGWQNIHYPTREQLAKRKQVIQRAMTARRRPGLVSARDLSHSSSR